LWLALLRCGDPPLPSIAQIRIVTLLGLLGIYKARPAAQASRYAVVSPALSGGGSPRC
jgi:hypothetical protein